ncbi:MAG TPA: response regulator [Candidatus Bathyarchaeia archaeon]
MVLIVDDDKSVLRTFSRILQKDGFETDVAETGNGAREKISKQTVDVVLVDYRLLILFNISNMEMKLPTPAKRVK